MLAQIVLGETTRQLKLQRAYQHYCSTSIHLSQCSTFHINEKVEIALHFWLPMHGPKLYRDGIVRWCQGGINASMYLGMCWQIMITHWKEWAAVNSVLISVFEPSGARCRVFGSGGPTVGQTFLNVQGSRGPSNQQGVISPKSKISLRKYSVTWPPAHVEHSSLQLLFWTPRLQPLCPVPFSHAASCRSHKQEGGLQKCAILAPSPNHNRPMVIACKKLSLRESTSQQTGQEFQQRFINPQHSLPYSKKHITRTSSEPA